MSGMDKLMDLRKEEDHHSCWPYQQTVTHIMKQSSSLPGPIHAYGGSNTPKFCQSSASFGTKETSQISLHKAGRIERQGQLKPLPQHC